MDRPDSEQALVPHWYFISTWECPICGRSKTYRERQYTPRPEAWEDRHEYREVWDYCDAF